MRRTAVALFAVAVAVLALAGCGDSGNAGHGDDASPKRSPSPTPGKEQLYLDAAHGLTYYGAQPDDGELLAFPPQWCKELQAGHDMLRVIDTPGSRLYPHGKTWRMAKPDARTLLDAGVAQYCPAQRGKIAGGAQNGGGTSSPTPSATSAKPLHGQCRYLTLDEVAEATGQEPDDAAESMGFCMYLVPPAASTLVSAGFHSGASDIGSGAPVPGLGRQARWDDTTHGLHVRTHGGVFSLSVTLDGGTKDPKDVAVALFHTAEPRLP